jgi:hypothetical protein
MSTTYGVQLIGGELPTWSDLRRPLPGGPLIDALAERTVPIGSRVLLAGPHQAGLVELLLDRTAHLSCLVRSVPDAEELGRQWADAAGFSVLCGSLDMMDQAHSFDAIIAIGGLHRLGSPDGSPLTWAESLQRINGMLAPGGVLLLGIDNPLGLHRLVTPQPVPDQPWESAPDQTLPSPSELDVTRCFAAFPDSAEPAVLLSVDLLAQRIPAGDVRSTLISAALTSGFASKHVLCDPRRLAATALGCGQLPALAPGWIVVSGAVLADLPAGLAGDGHGHWGTHWELRQTTDGWERNDVRPSTAGTAGRVIREPKRLHGQIPAGSSLEVELLNVCANADTPALRRMLRVYGSWLAGQCVDGLLPGNLVFAEPGNVLIAGESCVVLDPSWELAEPIPYRLALARMLRQFTLRMLAGGHRNPWPSTLDLDGIAIVLMSMTGQSCDRALLQASVRLEAELTAARKGLTALEESQLISALESGRPSEVVGHREALMALSVRTEELAEARSREELLNASLLAAKNAADQQNLKLEKLKAEKVAAVQARKDEARLRVTELRRIRSSRSYRLGRLATSPFRLAGRMLTRS